MDILRRESPRLGVYLIICGLTAALAWGVRGQFGHEQGAALAGAVIALSVALVSPDEHRRNRVVGLVFAGILGTAIGGSLSYGALVGLLQHRDTLMRGVLLLGLKGAVWGGIAGAALGMALSSTRYYARDLLWLIVIVPIWMLFAPPTELDVGARIDSINMLAVLLVAVLLWLTIWKQDSAALFVSVTGASGLGVGLPLGFGICVLGRSTGIPIDWWKAAELISGCCLGIGVGLAAFTLDEAVERPRPVTWSALTHLSLFLVGWLVPAWNGLNTVTYWVIEKKAMPESLLHAYAVLAALSLVGGVLWSAYRVRPVSSAGAIVLLFCWLLWSTFLLQFAKMVYPSALDTRGALTQGAFVVLLIMVTTFALRRWTELASHGGSV